MSIFLENHVLTIGEPTVPGSSLTLTTYPFCGFRLTAIGGIEFIAENEFILCLTVGLEVGIDNHITIDAVGGDGGSFALHTIFAPLRITMNVLRTIEVMAVADAEGLGFVVLGDAHRIDFQSVEGSDEAWKRFGRCAVDITVGGDEVQTVGLVDYVQEQVDDVSTLGIDVVGSSFCPASCRIDVVGVQFEAGTIYPHGKSRGNGQNRHVFLGNRTFGGFS